MRLRLDPAAPPFVAAAVAPTAAGALSSANTIIACRRLAPADTVNGSGSGIASASVGAAEDGKGGNAVNVKGGGDPGDVGNGWCIGGIMLVVLVVGFSLACMTDATARDLGVRTAGAVVRVGSSRVVVAGGEGGVDGDGGVGPVVIACDNFDGAMGPCNRKNQQFFSIQLTNKSHEKRQTACRKIKEIGKGGERAHLFARRLLRYGGGAVGPRQARARLEPARPSLTFLFLLSRSGLFVLFVLLFLACTDRLEASLDPIHDPPNRRWRLRVRHTLLDHLKQVCAGGGIARVVRALGG